MTDQQFDTLLYTFFEIGDVTLFEQQTLGM